MNFDELSCKENLLNYWESTFTMWKKTPEMYSKLLSYLRELFNTDFEDFAPMQLVGEYRETANKTLILSTHPNANMKPKYIKFEHEQRKFRAIPIDRNKVEWKRQTAFAANYFTTLREKNISKLFYTNVEKLMRYYDQESKLDKQKYELLQKRIVQVDILPFYSKKIALTETNPVVQGALTRVKKFYIENEFDTMLIHGKMLYDNLLKLGFVKNNEEESLSIIEQGKELKIQHFEMEYNRLEKKGLAIPNINNLSDEQKKHVAEEMRKVTKWNRENNWEVITE